MNPAARFVKTEKGHDEIKNRTHKLEARTRQLLVMIDGGKPAADLLQNVELKALNKRVDDVKVPADLPPALREIESVFEANGFGEAFANLGKEIA